MRVTRAVRVSALALAGFVATQLAGPLAQGDATEKGAPAAPVSAAVSTGAENASLVSTAFTRPLPASETIASSVAAARVANNTRNHADAHAAATRQIKSVAVSIRVKRPGIVTLVTPSGVGPASLVNAGCIGGGARCNAAISFMAAQMSSGANWHNRCLALVSAAYGDVFSGIDTAVDAAYAQKAAGKLHATADYKSIPRGAVLWWASGPGQNPAGHVAISIGGGMAISSDAPTDDGRVGVVPISFFVTNWHKIFLGYSQA